MDKEEEQKVSLLQVTASVLASFLGVQSGKKYERDFTHGKPHHYIIIGLVGTALFVLLVWGVAKLVVHLAGV